MRTLHDADFPLYRHGAAVFAKDDPRPVVVGESEDAADIFVHVLNLGFQTAATAGAIHARKGTDAELGAAIRDLIAGDPQLDLPEPEPVEEAGWTLDRTVKRT